MMYLLSGPADKQLACRRLEKCAAERRLAAFAQFNRKRLVFILSPVA
jgi:hypothetical protein